MLTRAPFLSNGLRAYVDLPYMASARRAGGRDEPPRAGWPVLALLAVAGLLRPEAWLFSVAYLGYLGLVWEASPDPKGEPASAGRSCSWRSDRRTTADSWVAVALAA